MENDELMPGGYKTNTCVPSAPSTNNHGITPPLGPAGVCTNWVIVHGNMDYLKTTNGNCPDGKRLDGINKTSCK